MTKEEAIEGMYKKRTPAEWLAFREEFYKTLSKDEINEIGAGAMNMVEACGYVEMMQKKGKLNPNIAF